jgi:hypothetical protein
MYGKIQNSIVIASVLVSYDIRDLVLSVVRFEKNHASTNSAKGTSGRVARVRVIRAKTTRSKEHATER